MYQLREGDYLKIEFVLNILKKRWYQSNQKERSKLWKISIVLKQQKSGIDRSELRFRLSVLPFVLLRLYLYWMGFCWRRALLLANTEEDATEKKNNSCWDDENYQLSQPHPRSEVFLHGLNKIGLVVGTLPASFVSTNPMVIDCQSDIPSSSTYAV